MFLTRYKKKTLLQFWNKCQPNWKTVIETCSTIIVAIHCFRMLEKVLFGRFLISSVSQQNCGMYENIFCFESQYQGIWLKVPPLSNFWQKRRGTFRKIIFLLKITLIKTIFRRFALDLKEGIPLRRDIF